LYFVYFPTSYLVETGLIWVTYLLSKIRNRLDAVQRDDLRLSHWHRKWTLENLQVFTGPKERT